ncbi:MAG: tetratricopeptide repeat protein [Candidatus Doudnabacteria bacterium]|nr:tetratricopeptide repeat protein [Candidatus Doudnabacteria bacterium]
MPYQIIPTIIFLLAIFAAVLLVLRRLPEASRQREVPQHPAPHENLIQKGLPAIKFSKIKYYAVFWLKKIWRFALEAKGLVPEGLAVIKVKRLFHPRVRAAVAHKSAFGESSQTDAKVKSEQDYLEAIKNEPKNLGHYDNLGKHYLQAGNFGDAKDAYMYLTSHDSGKADYWANLGFAAFKLKDFKQAIEAYKNSLALDSSQPNRYYNLAQSYKMTGDSERAREALAVALQMDPQNFKFLELMQRLRN